jgi:hypothetical protein
VKAPSHLKLLASAVAVWAGFWVLGLPDYYQQYPWWLVAIGTAALVPPSLVIGVKLLRAAKPEHRAAKGRWLAFYFTVPLLVLDVAYCGVYLGHGAAYFARYWYLTAFYGVTLLYWPLGVWLTSRSAAGETDPSPSR